ncbi:MAG: thioredoxin family protein [Flavobacterium sp.]|nr:thioredoxin family protein [Pseudozobellia sp.]MBF01642.1 thioredoxin family protein [Flavobacterium sp.]MBG46857.1 thioredoxin family protein [Pseudozobellia sp.]|tara:strand:- start:23 stop:649 length:627 start_codon:yes stop_codon:yes gene_type:complete
MSISTENEAQTTLIKKALSQAVSYPDYREMVNQLALEGRSTGPNQTEALANYTILNDRRMKRFDKTVKLSDETISNIENIDRPLILLVLTESWCGDAAPALPVMNKVAELSDVVDLKVVLRDEHLELMDEFLTNGARSIPKLLVIDKNSNEVVEEWGPRPEPAARMVIEHKEKFGKIMPELKEELQQWYNKDKGQTIAREVLASLALK